MALDDETLLGLAEEACRRGQLTNRQFDVWYQKTFSVVNNRRLTFADIGKLNRCSDETARTEYKKAANVVDLAAQEAAEGEIRLVVTLKHGHDADTRTDKTATAAHYALLRS